MAGTPVRTGPAFLAAAAADIASVVAAANTFRLLRHIHLANKTGAAVLVTLYVGLTGGSAAGTEIYVKSVAANGVDDIYFPAGHRMATTDFLTGLAASASAVTIEVMAESFVL